LMLSASVCAGPFIPAGDLALRNDIQRLADYGVIGGTVTTWPLAWGPILDDLAAADTSGLPIHILDSIDRVSARANWETRSDSLTFDAEVGVSDNATRIRSFQRSPRGRAEVSAGVNWIGDWFSADLNLQYVDDQSDNDEVRFDNSMLGAVAGNWSVTVNTLDRWWGPGYDGSLILSNNARPIPSLVLDRIYTDPFKTKWLSWLGPWDFSVLFGQLEENRAVPNARFFGMRFNFRPFSALEIGLSRTAQWCGDGRPCDFDVFADLLFGRDNIGDEGIGDSNEPGNQMAGVDFRWVPGFSPWPVAAYAQFIGEDEAGGLPSRYLVMAGIEGSGYLRDRWSYTWFTELAGTSCNFISEDRFNCAYRQNIYQSGYTFRKRSIGHGADGDAKLVSLGWVMVDQDETQWRALARFGDLNRGGAPDDVHTLTPTPQEIVSIDIAHTRAFEFGAIEIGLGFESIDDAVSGSSTSDGRVYVQWRSSY
ncbi:MAG: capsule assembly Wzi family protein, partial [Pseudomonadota bacterium]